MRCGILVRPVLIFSLCVLGNIALPLQAKAEAPSGPCAAYYDANGNGSYDGPADGGGRFNPDGEETLHNFFSTWSHSSEIISNVKCHDVNDSCKDSGASCQLSNNLNFPPIYVIRCRCLKATAAGLLVDCETGDVVDDDEAERILP